MTTQNYPFTGNDRQSMTFTPILDGTVYNCQVKWNIAGMRWYVLITDGSGNTILNTPLVGSVLNGGINIISGVFNSSSMYWREKNGLIEVNSS